MNIKVIKRNGKKEPVMLDKILDRITQQTYGLDKLIIPFEVAQKVIEGITPDIKTSTLDQLAMETAASLATKHPDYSILAARLAITNLHKETKKSFSETVSDLYNYVNPKTGKHSPIVSENFFNIVKESKNGKLFKSTQMFLNNIACSSNDGYIDTNFLKTVFGTTQGLVELPIHTILTIGGMYDFYYYDDYEKDEKQHTVILSETGMEKMETLLKDNDLLKGGSKSRFIDKILEFGIKRQNGYD